MPAHPSTRCVRNPHTYAQPTYIKVLHPRLLSRPGCLVTGTPAVRASRALPTPTRVAERNTSRRVITLWQRRLRLEENQTTVERSRRLSIS